MAAWGLGWGTEWLSDYETEAAQGHRRGRTCAPPLDAAEHLVHAEALHRLHRGSLWYFVDCESVWVEAERCRKPRYGRDDALGQGVVPGKEATNGQALDETKQVETVVTGYTRCNSKTATRRKERKNIAKADGERGKEEGRGNVDRQTGQAMNGTGRPWRIWGWRSTRLPSGGGRYMEVPGVRYLEWRYLFRGWGYGGTW